MRQRTTKNEVASVLLFTDGLANVGYQTLGDIKRAMMDPEFAAKNDSAHGGFNSLLNSPNYYNPPQQMPLQPTPAPNFVVPQQQVPQQIPQQQMHTQQMQAPMQPTPVPISRGATEKPAEGKEVPLTCTVNTFGFGSDHGKLLVDFTYLMSNRCKFVEGNSRPRFWQLLLHTEHR
jgi:hypothetical protein